MAIAHRSKQSHDQPAAHASTDAGQLGPGKQTLVEAHAADAHGHAGGHVEAEASRQSKRQQTETEAIFQLGKYAQRVQDAFGEVEDRVGKSKNLQQAASTALGAAGSLLADKAGAEIGKGLGFVIGEIGHKVSEALGEKAPEVEGDKTAAAYLDKCGTKLYDIIHSQARHIPDHHASMAELNHLIAFLHSPVTKKDAIKARVNQKLMAYQNSVEHMYEKSRSIGTGLKQESPVLGRVPDPKRGHALHLAVVQETKHNVPGSDGPPTYWAVLSFVPDGLGPEAYAVMNATHSGQPIRNFTLIDQDNVMSGIKPA